MTTNGKGEHFNGEHFNPEALTVFQACEVISWVTSLMEFPTKKEGTRHLSHAIMRFLENEKAREAIDWVRREVKSELTKSPKGTARKAPRKRAAR
jgi:hypothetical protein